MSGVAWESQSRSLVRVQRDGAGLERAVREALGWPSGRITYDAQRGYELQADAVHPAPGRPQTVVSVTYTNPDTPGHSNENKLHLKLGELALLKAAHPDVRVVLAIGGAEHSWLGYVLRLLEAFHDEVILLWREQGRRRLRELAREPHRVAARNQQLWQALSDRWRRRRLSAAERVPPRGLVRYHIADLLRLQDPVAERPGQLDNEIARLCLQRSAAGGGAEWHSYVERRWGSIEMSRTYFNPVEAAVELSLAAAGLEFAGGVARDVAVPNLLDDLGMGGTRLSEDFVLRSRALDRPVYIQCKSSGGGRAQHGKNIQNRAKEQITRGLLYSCRSPDGARIELRPRRFHWVAVLDGDWGVTTRQPLKYLHMLELAGYDRILRAGDLIDDEGQVLRGADNPLVRYLVQELDCEPERQLRLF